jgi:hypothetical protein
MTKLVANPAEKLLLSLIALNVAATFIVSSAKKAAKPVLTVIKLIWSLKKKVLLTVFCWIWCINASAK